MRIHLLCVVALALVLGHVFAACPTDYTFAVLSDVHIGENTNCVCLTENSSYGSLFSLFCDSALTVKTVGRHIPTLKLPPLWLASQIPYAEAAVARINELAQSKNIRWVFITGDLTSRYVPHHVLKSLGARSTFPALLF